MMIKLIDQQYKDLVQQPSYDKFLEKFSNHTPQLRRELFEWLSRDYLNTHDIYGQEEWYLPENLPSNIIQNLDLSDLIAGKSTKGFDIASMHNSGSIAECKLLDDGSTFKFKELANKDKFLDSTNVKNRILIIRADGISKQIERLDNWTIITDDEVLCETTWKKIKQYVSAQKIDIPRPYTYRTALPNGSTAKHKKIIEKIWRILQGQIIATPQEVASLIAQLPSSVGKGTLPILLWYNFIRPYLTKVKKKKNTIRIVVNPDLTVLSANLKKSLSHIRGLGKYTPNKLNGDRVIVVASDVKKGTDDAQMLSAIQSLTTTCKKDTDIIKTIDESKGDIEIQTVVGHSYTKLAKIIKALGLTVDFKYLDEVKHTVQDEDSIYVDTLKDLYPTMIRLGADANIRDDIEEINGKQQLTFASMSNKNTWKEIYQPITEKEAGDLGWKRYTKLHVYPFPDSVLPANLKNALEVNKTGYVKIKGSTEQFPFFWFVSLYALARYRLENPARQHTMLSFSRIDNVKLFKRIFDVVWPLLVKTYGDERNPTVKRLANLQFHNIYAHGKNTIERLRYVNSIPDNHNDSIIGQVRILGEGWDPENGWLDSQMFADPSNSSIRIYQTTQRSARIGNDIYNPKFKYNELIMISLVDTNQDPVFGINKLNSTIRNVATKLEIGKDSIDELVHIHEFKNINVPGGRKTKGSKTFRACWEMDDSELKKSFKSYYNDGSFNPFEDLVNEIFNDSLEIYQIGTFKNAHKQRKIIEGIVSNRKYENFFGQYKNPKSVVHQIRSGGHSALSIETKTKAYKLKKKWNTKFENFKNDRDGMIISTTSEIIDKYINDETARKELHGTDTTTVKGIQKTINEKTHDIVKEMFGDKVNKNHVLGGLSIRKSGKHIDKKLVIKNAKKLDKLTRLVLQDQKYWAKELLDILKNMAWQRAGSVNTTGQMQLAPQDAWTILAERYGQDLYQLRRGIRPHLQKHRNDIHKWSKQIHEKIVKLFLKEFKNLSKYENSNAPATEIENKVLENCEKQGIIIRRHYIVEVRKSKELQPYKSILKSMTAKSISKSRIGKPSHNAGQQGVRVQITNDKTNESKVVFKKDVKSYLAKGFRLGRRHEDVEKTMSKLRGRKGKSPSLETRMKMSKSLKGKNTWTKGQIPWNKGKQFKKVVKA